MDTIIYRAKYSHPFEKGSELDLVEDFRRDGSKSGMFMGLIEGKLQECFMEFREIEIDYAFEDDD